MVTSNLCIITKHKALPATIKLQTLTKEWCKNVIFSHSLCTYPLRVTPGKNDGKSVIRFWNIVPGQNVLLNRVFTVGLRLRNGLYCKSHSRRGKINWTLKFLFRNGIHDFCKWLIG